MEDAKLKIQRRYQDLCAQYAHFGFQIEEMTKRRDSIRTEIKTLNEANRELEKRILAEEQEKAKTEDEARAKEEPGPEALREGA